MGSDLSGRRLLASQLDFGTLIGCQIRGCLVATQIDPATPQFQSVTRIGVLFRRQGPTCLSLGGIFRHHVLAVEGRDCCPTR
jgi:hypothetical protein